MKRVFLFSFIYILYTSNVFSQVSIYPEIGLNYRSYTLVTIVDKYNHRTPEPYINIVGEVKLNSKFALNSRIGYVFRQNRIAALPCGVVGCPNAKFINRDMNLSINLMYPIIKNLRIGLGGGIYYKLKAHFVVDFFDRDLNYILRYTEVSLYNTQILLDYQYKDFKFITTYSYLFNNAENEDWVRVINGNNEVTLGVGYQLFKGKSKK